MLIQVFLRLRENAHLPEEQRRSALSVYDGSEYAGYFARYGGQFESAQTASRRLLITTIVVVLCIGMLLAGSLVGAQPGNAQDWSGEDTAAA